MAKKAPQSEGTRPDADIARLEKQLALEEMRATRAVSQALSSMFRSAGDSRLRADLRGGKGSNDYVQWVEREKVVNVSRALLAQSPVYNGFIDRMIDYTVGTGLVPVGESDEADRACALFNDWADDHADARGMDDFGELQRKVLREMLSFGDAPVIKTIGDDGEQALQLVPSVLLQSDGRRPPRQPRRGEPEKKDNRQADGVEMNQAGKPVAFTFAAYDPTGATVTTSTQSVDAENVIFTAWRLWSHQTRGMPWLTSALERFIDLNEFIDAVLTAAKLQAALALLYTSKNPNADRRSLTSGTQSVPGLGTETGTVVQNLMDGKPGQIIAGPDGAKLEGVQGTQPNSTFESFVRGVIMMACAAAGLPIEVATGDYSKANFSVARMARIAAKQTARPIRKPIERFCWEVYTWRINRLIADGTLRASGLDEYMKIRWQAPAMEVIDPELEYKGNAYAVATNQMTLQEVHAANGREYDTVIERREFEAQDQRDRKIEPAVMPGSAAPAGKNPDRKGGGSGSGSDRAEDE